MRLKEAMKRLDSSLDYGVVIKKENIYYLTGFSPTSFAVLVLGDKPYIAVSEMDAELSKDLDIEVKAVKSFKKELKFKGGVGVEKRNTTLGFAEDYLKGCKVEDIRFIEEMRQVKEPEEIERIKGAVKVAEKVLRDVKTKGVIEREVAARISYELNKAAGVAFEPIVSSGRGSAVPHHTPSDKRIKSEGPVIVDLGARHLYYNSDLTRTFSESPSKKFKEIYRAVVEAQREGIKQLSPGSRARECDDAVRAVLSEYGFERFFIHSSGHGVGLEVHEPPRISKESSDILKEGMIVTIEPGVYIPGWGGVRIEDMVLIGKKPRVLSSFPKMDF